MGEVPCRNFVCCNKHTSWPGRSEQEALRKRCDGKRVCYCLVMVRPGLPGRSTFPGGFAFCRAIANSGSSAPQTRCRRLSGFRCDARDEVQKEREFLCYINARNARPAVHDTESCLAWLCLRSSFIFRNEIRRKLADLRNIWRELSRK